MASTSSTGSLISSPAPAATPNIHLFIVFKIVPHCRRDCAVTFLVNSITLSSISHWNQPIIPKISQSGSDFTIAWVTALRPGASHHHITIPTLFIMFVI